MNVSDRSVSSSHTLSFGVLLGRKALGLDRVDADGLANPRGHREPITREDVHPSDAEMTHLVDDLVRASPELVLEADGTEVAVVNTQGRSTMIPIENPFTTS